MRVLVIGSNGKMGALTKSILEKDASVEAVYGYDQTANQDTLTFNRFDELPHVDVAIDFSTPKIICDILEYSKKNQVPLVIATTGFSESDKTAIENHAQHTPVFISANYAFGVAVLSEILRHISQTLSADFDIEIIEKHHHHKVDAPSGTSLHLAQVINSSIESPKNIINGHQGKREREDLAIHAMRGGSVVGEHQVIFAGQDETIELTHIAQSKSIFSYGAIKAAKFIMEQKQARRYDMTDLFKETI